MQPPKVAAIPIPTFAPSLRRRGDGFCAGRGTATLELEATADVTAAAAVTAAEFINPPVPVGKEKLNAVLARTVLGISPR